MFTDDKMVRLYKLIALTIVILVVFSEVATNTVSSIKYIIT